MKCHVCQSLGFESSIHMSGAPYIDRVRSFDSNGDYLPQLGRSHVWCSRGHMLNIETTDGTYCGHQWRFSQSLDFPHTAPLSQQDLKDLKRLGAIIKIASSKRHDP
jgi:hypothetical protein